MAEPADRVRAVFDHAVELETAAARSAYLDEVCADSPSLRREVEGLLAAYDHANCFLEKPLPSTGPFSQGEMTGIRIGRYKLLQQIGEGGMGTVYLAEQTEPVRRMVALKVIK